MALIEVKEYQKVCLQTCSFAHLWFFLITMDQLYLICRRKVLVKNPVLIVLFFVIISMHFMRRLERRPPKLLCIISWMWHGVAWHMYEPVWQRRSVKSIFMLVYMSCIRWNALMWFSCEGLSERSKLPLWQHPCICMFNFHFWNHFFHMEFLISLYLILISAKYFNRNFIVETNITLTWISFASVALTKDEPSEIKDRFIQINQEQKFTLYHSRYEHFDPNANILHIT